MSKVRVSRETTVSVVQARCRRGGTMGRGARGRSLPTDTLPSPPLSRPLRRRPGAPVAGRGGSRRRRRTNSRGGRHGRGVTTAAVRACGAPCVEVLLGSCATCGAWSVTPPSPGCIAASRMQPSRRPGAAPGRHSPPPQSDQHAVGDMQGMGARAELEPWCRRGGAGPVGPERVREQTSVAWCTALICLSRWGRPTAPEGQFCCAVLCAE